MSKHLRVCFHQIYIRTIEHTHVYTLYLPNTSNISPTNIYIHTTDAENTNTMIRKFNSNSNSGRTKYRCSMLICSFKLRALDYMHDFGFTFLLFFWSVWEIISIEFHWNWKMWHISMSLHTGKKSVHTNLIYEVNFITKILQWHTIGAVVGWYVSNSCPVFLGNSLKFIWYAGFYMAFCGKVPQTCWRWNERSPPYNRPFVHIILSHFASGKCVFFTV